MPDAEAAGRPASPRIASRATFRQFSADPLASHGIALRPIGPDDRHTVTGIYRSTREEELARTPWNEAQKNEFVASQSALQEQHYGTHYPGCERLLILLSANETDGRVVGRVYVDIKPSDFRLMDITILTLERGKGIGRRVTEEVLSYADVHRIPASLHVEPFNPVRRMYERMGFAAVETRGIYEFMVRPVTQP